MAKAKWMGLGILKLKNGKSVKFGEEFDSEQLSVSRFNQLVDKKQIDGSKRREAKAGTPDEGDKK